MSELDTELKEIAGRESKATPGPWELETDTEYLSGERRHYTQQWVMTSDGKRLFDADNSDLVLLDRDDDGTEYDLTASNNLEFAAHARQDIPRLLSLVTELRAQVAQYTARVNEPQNEAGETAAEPEDFIFALKAQLAEARAEIEQLKTPYPVPGFVEHECSHQTLAENCEICVSNCVAQLAAAHSEIARLKAKDEWQPIIAAAFAWSNAWGVVWDGNDSQSAHDDLNNACASLYGAVCDYERSGGLSYQRRLYDECITAGWDSAKQNSFAEEIAHLHEELSEAFRAYRQHKDFAIHTGANSKPEGIPIEFADVVIGLFYNAELHGFDLFAAIEQKHQFNLTRNYNAEGRQLHAPPAPNQGAK